MVNNRNWGPPEFHTILLGGHNDFKKCRHLQKVDEKNKESDFKKIYQIQTVLDFSKWSTYVESEVVKMTFT